MTDNDGNGVDMTKIEKRICFACRAIAEPRPLTEHDDASANERRCGACGQAAAVELDRAAREGWLTHVTEGAAVSL